MTIEIGSEAPDFALPNQHRETVRLSDYLGDKNVVLVFYPLAFTPTCTGEICALRDEGQAYADRLTAAGVKTIHHEFDSLIHGFVGLRGTVQAAARAMDDMVAGLRHELAQLGR